MCTPFHYSALYLSQDMKITQMSKDRKMNKEIMVYLSYGILCNYKKIWNIDVCKSLGGTGE